MPSKAEIIAEFNKEFLRIAGYDEREIARLVPRKLRIDRMEELVAARLGHPTSSVGARLESPLGRAPKPPQPGGARVTIPSLGRPRAPRPSEIDDVVAFAKPSRTATQSEVAEFNREFLSLSGFTDKELARMPNLSKLSSDDVLNLVKERQPK